MSLPNNTLILTKEPFVGFMPADLRIWLRDHNKDADLAIALAEVSNHIGRLGHELDEVDDHCLVYAYEEWEEGLVKGHLVVDLESEEIQYLRGLEILAILI